MTGQIPSYGKNFRLGRASCSTEFKQSLYILKWDHRWHIRSDKTSKRWYVFHGETQMGKVWPSLTVAMAKLIEGIEQGFYDMHGAHLSNCKLQGSGLNKSCNCGLDALEGKIK